jgi:hypothetical protein
VMMAFAIPRGRRRRLVLRPGRIEVAAAAVAGDHCRLALFGGHEFAVPDDVSGAEILHGAPWRVADRAGVARRRADKKSHPKSGGSEGESGECVHGAHLNGGDSNDISASSGTG